MADKARQLEIIKKKYHIRIRRNFLHILQWVKIDFYDLLKNIKKVNLTST